MTKKLEKIKAAIQRLTLEFLVSFVVVFVVEIVLITIFFINWSWLILGFMILFGVLIIVCLLAIIGGFAFLKANKKWTDPCKVKWKKALEWGLVFWKYTARIDVLADKCKEILCLQEKDNKMDKNQEFDDLTNSSSDCCCSSEENNKTNKGDEKDV